MNFNTIKKATAFSAISALLIFAGCTAPQGTSSDGKISIVCTVFPQYDWVKTLTKGAEDKYEISLLTDKGVDIHSFQPSADDIIKLSECQLVIYTGGESDEWVRENTQASSATAYVNMLEAVKDDALYDFEENEIDEHIWLSLDNAEEICEKITEELVRLDPQNKSLYEKNEELYEAELERLDLEYELALRPANTSYAVIADRFPFRYLFEEYDLNYYAAFPGCSAETEASFETVQLLSEKAKNTSAILVTDNGNTKLAETIISNSESGNKEILSLCSLQSVKKEDIDGGMTYISAMQDNLKVLKKIFN